MLAVVDSDGNNGGVDTFLYTVNCVCFCPVQLVYFLSLLIITAANDVTCLPSPAPTIPASVHPNVTDPLATCQPWGLTIANGTKPYTIVLSALNSLFITNLTLGYNDDVFTYINRAPSNGQLMGESRALSVSSILGTDYS